MADGVDAAVKLAEQLQAPVCTTYLHNDAFPASHPLVMGPLGYQVKKSLRALSLIWCQLKLIFFYVQTGIKGCNEGYF